MHGIIEKSINEKLTLTFIHLTAVSISAWIMFLGGQDYIFSFMGAANMPSSMRSKIVLFSFQFIYFIRLCMTSFIFQKRKMQWNEVYEVGGFLFLIHLLFAVLILYNKSAFRKFDFLWIALYFLGSYLNTASEWKRMLWKKNIRHKGKLYTLGLFKYAMHINYFGDLLLFSALALLTGSLWALSIPIVMTLSFIFLHIPIIDRYLEERYGNSFILYSQETKKLIPWIY